MAAWWLMPDLVKKPMLILAKRHIQPNTLSSEGWPYVRKLPASQPPRPCSLPPPSQQEMLSQTPKHTRTNPWHRLCCRCRHLHLLMGKADEIVATPAKCQILLVSPFLCLLGNKRKLWVLQVEIWLWLLLQPSYCSTKPHVKVCGVNLRIELVLQPCASLKGIPLKGIFVNPGNINGLLLTTQSSFWEGTDFRMPGSSNELYPRITFNSNSLPDGNRSHSPTEFLVHLQDVSGEGLRLWAERSYSNAKCYPELGKRDE